MMDICNPILVIKNKRRSLKWWYCYSDLKEYFENIEYPTIFKENFKISNKFIPLIVICKNIP